MNNYYGFRHDNSIYFPAEEFMPNNMNDFNGMTNMMGQDNQVSDDNMNNSNLFTPYEGLVHGNLFKDQYEPYKNFQPARLIPTNEMEDALIKLDQYQFAMHELNLVLDVNPKNTMAMNQFINFRRQYNQALSDFETKYGAINVSSPILNSVPFGWVQERWPWEGRK